MGLFACLGSRNKGHKGDALAPAPKTAREPSGDARHPCALPNEEETCDKPRRSLQPLQRAPKRTPQRSTGIDDDTSVHGASSLAAQRYRKLGSLGRSANGGVYKALDTKTGDYVALKVVRRHPNTPTEAEACRRELKNHRKVESHPHIINLREVFTTRHHIAIVMDYADAGDLSEALGRYMDQEEKPMPEDNARVLFQQLISAVDYCHRLGVFSRDIKLDNILLTSGRRKSLEVEDFTTVNPMSRVESETAARPSPPLLSRISSYASLADSANSAPELERCGTSAPPLTIKLADFGLSRATESVGPGGVQTCCGTPEYMAPEVLLGDPYDGAPVDVWACGVVLYMVTVGRFPFLLPSEEPRLRPERMQAMFPRILSGNFITLPDTVSPELEDLLRRMLTADADARITIPAIWGHAWVARDMPPHLRNLNDGLIALRESQALRGRFGTSSRDSEFGSCCADGCGTLKRAATGGGGAAVSRFGTMSREDIAACCADGCVTPKKGVSSGGGGGSGGGSSLSRFGTQSREEFAACCADGCGKAEPSGGSPTSVASNGGGSGSSNRAAIASPTSIARHGGGGGSGGHSASRSRGCGSSGCGSMAMQPQRAGCGDGGAAAKQDGSRSGGCSGLALKQADRCAVGGC